jgi:hypothetical protein
LLLHPPRVLLLLLRRRLRPSVLWPRCFFS